jgi:HlyD family secretion protein
MGEQTQHLKTQFWMLPGKRSTIALATAGLLVTGATGIYIWNFRQKPTAAPAPTPIVKTPEIKSVAALGRIEPQGQVIKLAAPPTMGGSKVVKLLVKEGETIKKDRVIAILDSYDKSVAEVEQAKKEVDVAIANLNIVKAGAKKGEIASQKATIEKLKAQLQGEIDTNQAKISLLQTQLQGEIDQQQATIEKLKVELWNASREFDRYQKLIADGAISQSIFDKRSMDVGTAKKQLQEAQANLNKTKTTIEKQIVESQTISKAQQDNLQAQIEEAQANLSKIEEIRDVDVEKAQAEVNRANAALKQVEENLKLSYIKAPIDSKVLKINALPGEIVTQENGIANLGQTERMIAIAEVYESDVAKVRVGQKVKISSESGAFKGEVQGEVYQVGLQIGKQAVLSTDPTADVDARVVEVKIIIDREDSKQVADFTYSKVLVKIFLERQESKL